MKKLVLIVMILMTTLTSTFAQRRSTYTHRSSSSTSVSIIPKVGLNVADLTKSDGDARIGLATGAEFEFRFTPMFSLTLGGIYSQQGEKDAEFDYFNLPVLANVYVAPGLAVKLGLQPSFNVNDDDYNGVKSTDLSIPVGLSYEFNHFVFDARYNFGVTKVVDNYDCKNSVFQFTVGYKIDL
ncbi:MAG: porin family protein [Prevotella sp.]|jgi:hypothetical protein|nr:porin family protein [Prevotella sp.]MCI2081475.1 porin family protein [Prevotella sp.]MCI2103338.1 porin family protein [Prevotella sp.]HCN53219.1 hypothetical protein [Prevotella sp.]